MSRLRLREVKRAVIKRLNDDDIMADVTSQFETYLSNTYNIYKEQIYFEKECTLQRVANAIFLEKKDDREIYGETDGETIWINPSCSEIEKVLMHEALHDSFFVIRKTRSGKKKSLGCKDEHNVMEKIPFAY